MNTFKRKSLYAALAGLSALGVVGGADAATVYVNPDGLGQVLLYPYYTVRNSPAGNAYNTLLSVVNSTASVKAVKVRFLEGKASQEVKDFNLYLSPYDVWTGAVIGTSTGAALYTADTSCTAPAIPSTGTAFVNFAYSGDAAEDNSLDRGREGYFEIIEMGVVTTTSDVVAATHVNGVPANCATIRAHDAASTIGVVAPTGGLFGGESLISVADGADYTADATALDVGGAASHWFTAGSVRPTLNDILIAPYQSIIFVAGATNTQTWTTSIDAVSASLMRNNVYNEYVLDTVTKSGTDWVVTFPTKRAYYDSTGAVQGLFQRNLTSTGACDDVSLAIYDREERTTNTPVDFSPPPPVQGNALCWEANVVTFNNSMVLGSKNYANVPSPVPSGTPNGWLNLGLDASAAPLAGSGGVHALVSTTGTTYFGLPTVGFAVNSYVNGNVGGVLANYGGNFAHKYQRRFQ